MIKEQEISLKIKREGDSLTMNLEFKPGIVGSESADYAWLTEDERALQNFAGHVANDLLQCVNHRLGGGNDAGS